MIEIINDLIKVMKDEVSGLVTNIEIDMQGDSELSLYFIQEILEAFHESRNVKIEVIEE